MIKSLEKKKSLLRLGKLAFKINIGLLTKLEPQPISDRWHHSTCLSENAYRDWDKISTWIPYLIIGSFF